MMALETIAAILADLDNLVEQYRHRVAAGLLPDLCLGPVDINGISASLRYKYPHNSLSTNIGRRPLPGSGDSSGLVHLDGPAPGHSPGKDCSGAARLPGDNMIPGPGSNPWEVGGSLVNTPRWVG